jgi:transcriptional regulator with XRE-family HTH domain
MTTLKQHLKDQGQSLSAFAKRIGVSPSHMSEIASGKKDPSFKLARAIYTETGGEIDLPFWIDLANRRESDPTA